MVKPRRNLSREELVKGVLEGNRSVLGQAITLVESNAPHHLDEEQAMLHELMPHAGKSIRIGITGVPGAGKSTFTDVFGTMLCRAGHKVAVLAIDPSSTMTRGSILGDKTRMEHLAREPNAFIRPSPSGGTLGGVHRKSRETMMVCEAAGFDVILIETVGVGQSEAAVRSLCDMFILLTLTGAGDDLQGIKRGVMENADAVIINKADGDNLEAAQRHRAELAQAMHYITSPTAGWTQEVACISSIKETGLEEVWAMIMRFREQAEASGVLQQRRRDQVREWTLSMVKEQLYRRFVESPAVKELLEGELEDVADRKCTATSAARRLLEVYLKDTDHDH